MRDLKITVSFLISYSIIDEQRGLSKKYFLFSISNIFSVSLEINTLLLSISVSQNKNAYHLQQLIESCLDRKLFIVRNN